MSSDDGERFEPEDAQGWRNWLETHHGRSDGVWLVLRKKSAPVPNLGYVDAVRGGLSYGWIDSIQRRLDEDRSRLWMSPRKPGSWWSGINKRHVAELVERGLMRPAGQAAIDRALGDGTWTALDDVEAGVVPEDLAAAFAEHPGAAEQFAGFPRSARRGILEWIAQARRPATRAARVSESAELAARGERAHQWPPRSRRSG